MRTTTSHQQADAPSLSGHDRWRDVICSLAVVLAAACTSSNGQPGPTGSGGSGSASSPLASGGASAASSGGANAGSSGGASAALPGGASSLSGGGSSAMSRGGATSPPVNTGGSSSMPGTGGSAGAVGGGGSSGVSSGSSSDGAAGGKGGSASGSGGAGGSSGGSLSGGSGAAGGKGGSASGNGGTGGSGGGSLSGGSGAVGGKGGGASGGGGTSGSGGVGATGGTTSTALVIPPVRDTASKVPISSPPAGFTVEGNYAYGPLTSQRIDVLYPVGGGPKATQVLPIVVMFHGGAWIHSYTNNYPSGKDHMSTFFDRFLSHGFIVCNAEYRVNDGTVDGAPAPAAVQDALLAAKWCWDYMDYFHGDRTRYVVTGASAGGHLALMVGMTTADAGLGPTSPTDFKIAGIVDGYGPADIEAEIDGVAKGWLPASLPNRLAIAKQVNPMTYVRGDIPPLIVVQGSNDSTAPIADSLRLVANLKTAGADVTMHEVVGASHGFTDATWPDAEAAMFGWLTARGMGK